MRGGISRGSSDNGRGGHIISRFSTRGRGTANNIRGGLKGKQPGGGLRKVNWDLRTLEPLRKDFYVEHPAVRNRYLKAQKSIRCFTVSLSTRQEPIIILCTVLSITELCRLNF